MDMETRNFIAGAWCDGAFTLANVNPSDLSDVIGHYAQADVADVDRAVAAAREAQPKWAAAGIQRIQGILNGTTNYILTQIEAGASYASALAEAQGKVLADIGEREIHAVSYLENFLFTSAEARKPVKALSGGERRRAEIARALAANPRFVLLDEPFAGVDPIAVIDIQGIVRHLSERGIGVLITDHNVRETLGICTRAYILAAGTVIAEGAPAQLLENETVRRVYLGEQFRL